MRISKICWATKRREDSPGTTRRVDQTGQLLPLAAGRQRAGSTRGQSLLEFALILPILSFLIFGVVDFGRLFWVQMTLQDAVRQAGRFASTGNHLPDPNNPGNNLTRVASVTQLVQQAAAQAGVQVASIQVTSNGVSGSAGGPSDPVTITATVNLQLITPLIANFFPQRQYTFTVSVTFQNEPFSLGNTT